MTQIIGNTLAGLTLGTVQSYRNAQVVPVIGGPESSYPYTSLAAALRDGKVRVTEVSESGSVPELVVHNDSDEPILLVDGEELVGAKQNRILNASMLIPARSRLTVPVSCTEQGRWSYTSRKFDDSGLVAAREVRRRKNRSVQDSLEARASYMSDQGAVWDSITELSQRSKSYSRTGAMRDVFEDHRARIDQAIAAFARVENQRGMFFIAGGKMLGVDVLSRPAAYADLHEKLIRSYAIDLAVHPGTGAADPERLVYEYMASIKNCEVSKHAAVGVGNDFRLSGENVFGAALVVEQEVIHLNAFPSEEDPGGRATARMAGYRERRSGLRPQ